MKSVIISLHQAIASLLVCPRTQPGQRLPYGLGSPLCVAVFPEFEFRRPDPVSRVALLDALLGVSGASDLGSVSAVAEDFKSQLTGRDTARVTEGRDPKRDESGGWPKLQCTPAMCLIFVSHESQA
ncbi:unnamed protein product [Protopolystoma xenopodis]|uniref:Uncharacterized protein n=1 Tax=Protopolystoma xenopodis TaxID=117903 RepID=A0A448XIP5_9PLAT|nr:unnamed protein product [Protopolystoma xenopodis]